ncbi:MAG: hypothetical protein QOE23_3920 [Pseudonocardiales bacterium]|nr:hypothetical protein [Pseudonocardiales bacterium]
MRAEDADSPELRALSPAEHIDRLDRLLADQADELARLHTILLEVTAVCDLAEWANDSSPDARATVVLVEDLRRILTRSAPDPVPPGS